MWINITHNPTPMYRLKIRTLVIALCLLAQNYISYSQSDADLGVAAIGLVVSDIEISENFYGAILGMKQVGEFSLDEPWSQDAGVANGKPFSVKVFKMKDRSSATVLKLAYFDNTEKSVEKQAINTRSGVNYMTLHYSAEEFKQVTERIAAAAIKKWGWVKRDSYQLFFIQDPDGLFVEIVGPPDN